MENMTVIELFAVVVAVAGLMLTLLRISDMVTSRQQKRKTAENKEILQKLDDIKLEQKDFKMQLVSLTRLTVTMAEELEAKGRVNGGTETELNKLKNELFNK